ERAGAARRPGGGTIKEKRHMRFDLKTSRYHLPTMIYSPQIFLSVRSVMLSSSTVASKRSKAHRLFETLENDLTASSGDESPFIAAYLAQINPSLRILSRAASCSANSVPDDQLGSGSYDCTLRDCDCYVARLVLDWLGTANSNRWLHLGRGRGAKTRVGAHTNLTMSPAASRPHFLNRWKHFNAGSSLATNRIAGRFPSPLTCSNQEPPGTARLSNFSHSKRLPSMIECPLPSSGATSRLAVCRTGRVFSPGRSTCAKNVMVLNTGPPFSGSLYSIDSAS